MNIKQDKSTVLYNKLLRTKGSLLLPLKTKGNNKLLRTKGKKKILNESEERNISFTGANKTYT